MASRDLSPSGGLGSACSSRRERANAEELQPAARICFQRGYLVVGLFTAAGWAALLLSAFH